MKKSLRIITIGSIFLLCGASFFGIISVGSNNISSEFWNVRQIATIAHADDDDDEHENESHERRSSRREVAESEDREDDDHRASVSNSPISTPVSTPTQSTSTNSNTSTTTTPTQTCTTVYDTVTNASGTATQVPRQSCTTNPVTTTSTTTTPVTTTTIPAPVVVTPIPSPVIVPTPAPVIVTTPAQFRDGTYTGIGKYSFGGGSVDYGVSITITSGKISAASFTSFTVSGNGKYTRAQGDATLQKLIGSSTTTIDTVTGATGTSKAIQDAIDSALSQARTSAVVTTSTVTTTPTSNTVVTPNTHKNIPTTTLSDSATPTSHTTPNGKEYSIIALSTGSYIFERSDGTLSSRKFATTQRLISYLDQNNPLLQEEGGYTAPNGKQYTVIYNATTDVYAFKRADGSMASRDFETKNALITYLRGNNPVVVKKPVVRVVRAVKKVVAQTPSTPVKSTPVAAKPVVAPVSTTTSTVNIQAATQTKAAADRAAAQAAAQAQAAAAAKAAQAAAAAKVNTTTKAS